METEIWGIPSCDSCRKARKVLPDAVFRDVRQQPLDGGERAALLEAFGDKAINRASTTWRGLDAETRSLPAAELLERHPTLMKRPVIRQGGALHLGFTPAVRAALGIAPDP